jgi:hypothetical protein
MKLIYCAIILFSLNCVTAQLSTEKINKLLQSGSKRELVHASTDFLLQGNFYQASLVAGKLVEM